jgi:hypothetical protein
MFFVLEWFNDWNVGFKSEVWKASSFGEVRERFLRLYHLSDAIYEEQTFNLHTTNGEAVKVVVNECDPRDLKKRFNKAVSFLSYENPEHLAGIENFLKSVKLL